MNDLVEVIKNQSNVDCSICLEPADDPVIVQ